MKSISKKSVIIAVCILGIIIFIMLAVNVYAIESGNSLFAGSGWVQSDGKWSYIDMNGNTYCKGVYTINGKTYLFNKSGHLLTGARKAEGKLYYFSNKNDTPENGFGQRLNYKGFKSVNSKVYYFNNNHSLASGFKTISGNKFYFSPSGVMRTGWLTKSGDKYYFSPSGKLGSKGKAAVGWKKLDGKKYWFKPSGKMTTGIKKIGKYKYCFNLNGELRKGIVKTKKGKYFADKKGRVNTKLRKAIKYKGSKWLVLNGKVYSTATRKRMTLYRAMKIVNKITKPKMSKAKKLKICFDYVKKTYSEMNPRIPHYHGKDWTIVYANDMFIRGKGNCLSYAAAFAYMAKAIGCKNVYCCHSGGHGWAEVNNKVYDPEWSMHHKESSYYALPYSAKPVRHYKGAISAGYSWMHVKL